MPKTKGRCLWTSKRFHAVRSSSGNAALCLGTGSFIAGATSMFMFSLGRFSYVWPWGNKLHSRRKIYAKDDEDKCRFGDCFGSCHV